jgi:nucleoside-diphosphate-sugar epimerase
MRVLVTGATGFLGQRLVKSLLREGTDVRCLVRPSSNLTTLREISGSEAVGRLELFQGSLGQIDSCAEAMRGCEVVFHLAAALRGAPAVLFLNNVIATRQLIGLSCRMGIRRFVLVSSLGVYGTQHLRAGDLLDEQCPLDPEPHRRDAYSYSKVVQEQVAWEACRAACLPLVVIRPGVIYGPSRDCLSGRVGLRFGNFLIKMGGRQQLPYTFVANCAEAIALAGFVRGAEGEAFNIVDDDPPTSRELLKQYRKMVGRIRVLSIPHWAISPLSRLCERYHQWSDGQLPAVLTPYKSAAMWKRLRYTNAKAKAVLGWKPRISFAEGLEPTFAWLRQQGDPPNRSAA